MVDLPRPTVRIAPSPTGNLHIGTVRTALFNWLFARKHGGQFLLRIEDTDRERSTPEYEKDIIEGLQWLGLQWDNDHIVRQSERTAVYRTALKELLASGAAQWRTYSREEQQAMVADGRTAREKVIILTPPADPEREVAFDDLVRGRIAVQAKHISQLVIAKSLDEPLYHFAVVVDDIDANVTHVIRGEDHISNTPKHLLMYEALGKTPPFFAHLPLILGSDRSKMSKRHGATNIADYRADYLPDALVNYLAYLGHTYSAEILTRDEMIAGFDLAKVHDSGAVFDQKKLDWVNAQYVRHMPAGEFKRLIGHPELSDTAIALITDRLDRISQTEEFSYLWTDPDYAADLLRWKDTNDVSTKKALEMVGTLAGHEQLTGDYLDRLAVEHFDGQKGNVYWPLRVALSGLRASAGPLDIVAAIGLGRARARISTALKKVNNSL